MTKNILIISPINQWGGVNVDVGFMAEAYKDQGHEVFVLSLGDYYEDSSIFEFINKNEFDSINRMLMHQHFGIKVILQLLNVLKPLNKPLHHRLKNRWTKKIYNLNQLTLDLLYKTIDRFDVVLMCHHFTGDYVVGTAQYCQKHQKPYFIRVTAQINERHFDFNNLSVYKSINNIIIHSSKNLPFLNKHHFDNVVLIDQCVYMENQYTKHKFESSVQSFYTLGRIEKIKNIEQMVKAFMAIDNPNITLDIYGDGSQKEYLINMTKHDTRIQFHAPVTLDNVFIIHNQHQCLLITSHIEGGPYTALEAMCAGNLIISTRVGAMEDRLGTDYSYFYDGTDAQLKTQIQQILDLTVDELNQNSNHLRAIYTEKYAIEKIKRDYQKLLI